MHKSRIALLYINNDTTFIQATFDSFIINYIPCLGYMLLVLINFGYTLLLFGMFVTGFDHFLIYNSLVL